MKKGDVYVFKNIFYDYGKADLREESISELNKLVEFLKNNPKAKVELGSHTDSRSSDAFKPKSVTTQGTKRSKLFD